jgi:Protein of unknown function (DUF3071)
MQELRFVAVSEDGSYAVLAVPGRSGRFILSIDERLRAVATGQTTRLAQYEIEVESPLRPKEIQARIRAGETAEEIADAAGIPVERVRWFEGPVLAERAYIADQAQAASVRRAGDSGGPGARLGDIVPERLTASGGAPEDGQWDSRKRGDGNWQVTLTFPSGGRLHVAEWVFDPRRRHVMPDDDNAARLSLPESELPPEPVSLPGEATVTPLAPRLGAAAGMGGAGGFASGGSGAGVRSFRPERSVIPDRSLGGDRSLADRPMSPPPIHAPAASSSSSPAASSPASAAASASASERPGVPDRPGLAHSSAATPVLPRPAYHDHTDFRGVAPEPPAHRESAAGQAAAHHATAPASAAPAVGSDGRRGFDAQAPEATVPVTAPPYVWDDPAASENAGRARVAASRQVVFEDPEPAFLDEQPELAHAAPESAPTVVTPPVGASETLPPPAGQVQAAQTSGTQGSSSQESAARTASATEAPGVRAPAAGPRPAAEELPTPAAAGRPTATAPADPRTVAASAAAALQAANADKGYASAQEQVSAPTPAATSAPAESVSRVAPPAHVGSVTAAESTAATAPGAAALAATHAPAQPEPAVAAQPTIITSGEPVSAPTARPAAVEAPAMPAASAAQPEPAAAAKPAPEPATSPADKSDSAEDQSTRQRPAAKKNAKARRSSVPSWDEIMLGSSRQRD